MERGLRPRGLRPGGLCPDTRPFTGFICSPVLRFSSIFFCFSYSQVRQTKLACSLVNVWAHDNVVCLIVWQTDWLICCLYNTVNGPTVLLLLKMIWFWFDLKLNRAAIAAPNPMLGAVYYVKCCPKIEYGDVANFSVQAADVFQLSLTVCLCCWR